MTEDASLWLKDDKEGHTGRSFGGGVELFPERGELAGPDQIVESREEGHDGDE